MSVNQAPWKIVSAAGDQSPEAEQFRGWLREFNHQANPQFMIQRQLPQHATRSLVLLAYDDAALVGGLCGQTQFSWLKIDIMAVDPAGPGRGIGTALVVEAEREAAVRGCKYSFVDTMSYQAPQFYQRQGYSVAGELPDWDSHGHAKFLLIKRLDEREA